MDFKSGFAVEVITIVSMTDAMTLLSSETSNAFSHLFHHMLEVLRSMSERHFSE